MTAKQKYHHFNGNVLVAENGKLIYKKKAGYSDFKGGLPLNDRSVFEIASVTKQFTAAAVLLCQQRGLLSLDNLVSKYLPQLPYQGNTLRQLLTHTSGLPEQNELMYKLWDSDKTATNNDLIETLQKNKPELTSKLGESFKYSNTNYALLASIVERVSGQRLRDFMSKNFFQPLKMKDTQILDWQAGDYSIIPNHTKSYSLDEETKRYRQPEEMPQWKKALPLNGIVGSRGVNTTMLDLLKWQKNLKASNILTADNINGMRSSQVQGRVDGFDSYGYGLAIKSQYGDTKVYHYWGWNGYWTALLHFQNSDRTIIVLSNNDTEKGLANVLAAIMFDQRVELPSLHIESMLNAEQLDRFAGTYEANRNSFDIENRSGKLFRVVKNGEPKELKAESANELFYDDGSDRQIEFIFEKNLIKQVFFVSEGIKIELKKVK